MLSFPGITGDNLYWTHGTHHHVQSAVKDQANSDHFLLKIDDMFI